MHEHPAQLHRVLLSCLLALKVHREGRGLMHFSDAPKALS